MGSRMVQGEERGRGAAGGFFPDKTNSTITFENSGFGFSKNELVNNLGTIAKSGTKVFLEARVLASTFPWLGSSGSASLAYLVSDKVRSVSKSFEVEQYFCESAAGVSFTVQNDAEMVHGEVKRDTKITFYLKEDQSEFSEERRLKDLVKTLFEFIGFPLSCPWRTRRRRK